MYSLLSKEDLAELERLGAENVRNRLRYSGPGGGAVVPGLGSGEMLRGDIEDWLAERDRDAAKLQRDTLWWAKAAAWIGAAGLIIAIIVALLGK